MAGKNDFRDRAKSVLLRGMKTIGNTAANIASNTKYKVDEMTLQNRRRELINDLSGTIYGLWLKGEKFPEPLSKMLSEIQSLDERLNDMRAERYALGGQGAISPEGTEGQAAEGAKTQPLPDAAGETSKAEKPAAVPLEPAPRKAASPESSPERPADAETSPIASEINGYFDKAASVGEIAEKMNSSMAQLSQRLREFSPDASASSESPASSGTPETPKEKQESKA